MGNRNYATLSLRIFSTLIILSTSILLITPFMADAASSALTNRLCERQASLLGRLMRPLIDPSKCAPAPEPVPTLAFTATPSTVTEGDSSTLEWNSTNTTSCTASDGWSGTKSTSGSDVVTPLVTTTYTLTCTGAGDPISKSVTVNVETPTPDPVPTLTFTASPMAITAGATSTLTWSSTNTSLCVAENGWSGTKGTSGTQGVAPSATTTYSLACGGQYGTTTQSVTVNVSAQPTPTPSPTVILTANPTSVNEGSAENATTTLTWSTTNATSCTGFGAGFTGAHATSGSAVLTPTTTTTYQLDCTGPGSGVGSDDAVVTFVPASTTTAPELTFTANPTTVNEGSASTATSTLAWNSTDADLCVASGGWDGTKTEDGTQIVQPTATTTYTLACGNETGTTTEDVTVNFVAEEEPTPSIDHLILSEVLYNATSTPEAQNEWVEIYNPTASAVNLEGWSIGDSTGTSTLPNISIQPGGYLVIAASTTPMGIPGGVPVVVLFDSIGDNGFSNTADAAILRTASNVVVDEIGWASGTLIVADGHSIVRSPLLNDTGLATDWADEDTPTPGQ